MPSIGVLTMELQIEQAHSLKEKRHVVASLKDRLRSRFNVAVAEIGYQDFWQRSLISAVTVSGDHTRAEVILQAVEREAEGILGGMLVSTTVEWIE
ncbi:MAG: DUF503 domain-containing protein [Bryobacteraceae bacterium]|nr:DUF503 domain-containing protein [Bryobacteraceae bacterium]